jgi:oxalate decarboxylase/phosphoglucose isomerase-like protein (cupin superfamily)
MQFNILQKLSKLSDKALEEYLNKQPFKDLSLIKKELDDIYYNDEKFESPFTDSQYDLLKEIIQSKDKSFKDLGFINLHSMNDIVILKTK